MMEEIRDAIEAGRYKEYKKWALDGVNLPEIAEVSENVNWAGVHYMRK